MQNWHEDAQKWLKDEKITTSTKLNLMSLGLENGPKLFLTSKTLQEYQRRHAFFRNGQKFLACIKWNSLKKKLKDKALYLISIYSNRCM